MDIGALKDIEERVTKLEDKCAQMLPVKPAAFEEIKEENVLIAVADNLEELADRERRKKILWYSTSMKATTAMWRRKRCMT